MSSGLLWLLSLNTDVEATTALGVSIVAHIESSRSAQYILYRRGVLVGNLVGSDLYNRTCQVFLARGTITNHH